MRRPMRGKKNLKDINTGEIPFNSVPGYSLSAGTGQVKRCADQTKSVSAMEARAGT